MDYGPAPESSREAADWIARHDGRFGHFIRGQSVRPSEGEYFETINPATGRHLATLAQGSKADVDAAVRAAREAQEDWWRIGPHARARYLYALARGIQKQSRLYATLETLDNGKPIRESRDIDVPLVIRHFYHHAGWAQLMPEEFPNYAPVGVCGQIIPWNFPLLMLAWKIAPALAMGNTVVLKPAEFTSLTALLFAELCEAIQLPPGVVNIVTGDGLTGAILVEHPEVDKIAFTGSTEVGRQIRQRTAGSGKKLTLELGGKSPFIVFDDADLDSVIEGIVDAIWFNQGQVCCAGSRLLVQESVRDPLIRKLQARMERLRVGDPMDKAIDIGAIVAPVQLQRIEALVRRGIEEGGTIWQPSWACPTEGYFYPPTLFTDVSPASTIAQVEIFGPVLVSMTFRSPEEAVELAANTPYGLAASVWSENINTALDIARQVPAGTVWINCTNVFDAASGFGGYRESGFGREGGKEGLWEYVSPPPSTRRRMRMPRSNSRSARTHSRIPPVDRTAKLYIGGKQVRPDQGYSIQVFAPDGALLGEVGRGNRKDIRNAVEAACAARAWGSLSGHSRAQVLYYMAENLQARASEFAARIEAMTGRSGRSEVAAAIEQTFYWAAWADKFDGAVHHTHTRFVTLAMNEPMGVVGVVLGDDWPLLGVIGSCLPLIAVGNAVVCVPSERHPLAATDWYQVLDTSDLPAGVMNLVTGAGRELAPVLAAHDEVASIWCHGRPDLREEVERASSGNLKRTWVMDDLDWGAPPYAREFLRHATQVKNIWIPYGA
jgi:aldehyde dehydrogenase (NAD+)